MFSILILTKNEEFNLPGCLNSVRWCDDVVVLDSKSKDRTQEIARAAGARVEEREFDDFGSQRNHALEKIRFQHPWIFQLDADEHFREELRAECERVVALDNRSAYSVPNRIFFMGRWIKHATQYPFPQVRLVKVGEVKFRKAGHGQALDWAKRGEGAIEVPYDHFNFSKGIGDWMNKHHHYAEQEAENAVRLRREPIGWGDLWGGDRLARLRSMKKIMVRLPGRGLVKFLYLYMICRGFLDGMPGLIYCGLQGYYEFLVGSEVRKLRNRKTSS
jgi:glycosyltransferase involved in cell wall biosynthesis